jgi:hypothetical protein
MKKLLDHDALKTACFEAARTTMWDRWPIDVAAIDAVAEQFFSIAFDQEEFVQGQERDPDLITRAVAYLCRTHAIPHMHKDTTCVAGLCGAGPLVSVAR